MKKICACISLAFLAVTVTAALAADGEAVYKTTCAGCHGVDGSRSFDGIKPLKDQQADEIAKKLQGYADGSYGGKQKKVMENVVKKLPADEIPGVAEYAGSL